MSHFYPGCSEDFLLGLSKDRFWNKYKNLSIIRLREKLESINTLRIAESKDGIHEIYRLNWQLEQLTGKEKTDSTLSIKERMKQQRIAGKKLKGKKK